MDIEEIKRKIADIEARKANLKPHSSIVKVWHTYYDEVLEELYTQLGKSKQGVYMQCKLKTKGD